MKWERQLQCQSKSQDTWVYPSIDWTTKRQTFRLRRLHLLGPDACIFWVRTPASTLHKSAQQEAPDAYISLCKEHNPRHACTEKIHAPQLARAKRRVHLSCTRPRDACATHLRASKTYARHCLLYARPRHARGVPLCVRPKDGLALCKDARA